MADSKEIAEALAKRARDFANWFLSENKRMPDIADFKEEFEQILEKYLK